MPILKPQWDGEQSSEITTANWISVVLDVGYKSIQTTHLTSSSDNCAVLIWCRAEPLLARIKADRTVVVSPVFDKVSFDDLQVVKYNPASHGFDWALWCMYENFRPEWFKMGDPSQPGKYVIQYSTLLIILHSLT